MLPTSSTDEVLINRMLPGQNDDRQDRAQAWTEWQASTGEAVLARFVRAHNNTRETDDDIIQDALLTAYLGVERGHYQPRDSVPFVSYVIGIARNKIREAWRRERHRADLDEEREELGLPVTGGWQRQPEHAIERREQRSLLQNGLSRLPVARRKVLEYYLSGASTGEIANRMEISEALVRQHKCRGLRTLQQDLRSADRLGRAA